MPHVPRLPRKVAVDVTKCHASHVKRRWVSQSATPATPTAAAPSRPLRPKRATGASPMPYVLRLPHKVAVDITKCHASHVKRRWMSQSATPATPTAAAPPRPLRPKREDKLCEDKLCDDKLFVGTLCVMSKLCDAGGGGGGRRRRTEAAGYRTKNKNPTQRCGEILVSWGYYSQYMEEKNVPNHQPVFFGATPHFPGWSAVGSLKASFDSAPRLCGRLPSSIRCRPLELQEMQLHGREKNDQNGDLTNKNVALKQQKCGFNQQKCGF